MLDKHFDPAAAEPAIYAGWEAARAFAADPASPAPPYTIMIPPPNVTGSLHIGHALTMTLQDILIRFRRMQGRDALWQPGTDHAGIATQLVVERLLAAEGTTRQTLGRDAFTDRVWQWKDSSGGAITAQLRRLGASLDWDRERFTMDQGLSRAVREVFVTLHEQGLIYQDRRLVNWDPKFQSAISDLEVEQREIRGHLWYLRYPIEGEPGRFITVATTRPETMLGDTAIAVHPDDPRYTDLIGRHAILPLVGRRLPIVADAYSDPAKGTGAVKITPAHDFNDFAVGQRHDLPMPSVLDREARITLAELDTEDSFLRALAGQDRSAARTAIIAELDRQGLLDRTEPHTHQVPHGDRSGVPIEPLLTVQWYCNAGALARPAIAAVEEGRTEFVPKQWENTFFAWMRDIQPWCISRQLWWGHRIPAWYTPDGQVIVARSEAEAQARAPGILLTQDPDVLDTWFSSALWPFSTLGWPEQTPDLARYYPGDVLVTGFDIIFFWVARMMMMGLHFMGEAPFRTVYIHALVRDERGQKMSKSKGNVIDPLELIDAYGTDALRFTVASLAGPGRDVKLGPARVEANRAFVTKLWNAARFLEMNGVRADAPGEPQLPLARWLLDGVSALTAEVTEALDAYRFDAAASALYRFTWNIFCDWFVELAKPVLQGADPTDAAEIRAAAAQTFGILLRLLHPVMPFVTETLWAEFGYGPLCSLIRASWPEPFAVPGAAEARDELDWVVQLVTETRSVRSEWRVPPASLIPILLRDASAETLARAARWDDAIRRLARASEIVPLTGPMPPGAAQIVLGEATGILPLGSVVDLAQERARLARDRDRAAAEAGKLAQKLANPGFTSRATPEIVEETRERLATAEHEIARLAAAAARIA